MSRKITTTSHGVEMSPRMSRLWTYIRIERGISLTDFSTDQCVERVATQLEVARDQAPTDELKRDIDCLLRRRPSTRVNTQTARKVTGTERSADGAMTVKAENWWE